MDFVGSGRRLAQGDVGDAARALGIETAVLLAFLEVEAAGRGFDSKNRPKMLFEPHVLYRNTKVPLRDRLVAMGLAYKGWGAKPYPADSYPRLKQAVELSKEAGWRSASYGLPQILGENHADAGFTSAATLFAAMTQGEREQLLAMVTLLKSWNMAPLLRGKDFTKAESWAPVAKRYNGSRYTKHNYHGRLAAAYVKHSKGNAMALPGAAAVLEQGIKGEAVRNVQADLQALGYSFPLGVDGRFGKETLANVRLFQSAAGLNVDGKVGPATLKAIAAALADKAEDFSPPLPEWPRQAPTNFLSVLLAAIAAFFMRMRKDKA